MKIITLLIVFVAMATFTLISMGLERQQVCEEHKKPTRHIIGFKKGKYILDTLSNTYCTYKYKYPQLKFVQDISNYLDTRPSAPNPF